MICSRCKAIGLIRRTRTTRVYGSPRPVTVTSPCPACGGTGKQKALPPMWWQDKDAVEPQQGDPMLKRALLALSVTLMPFVVLAGVYAYALSYTK